MNKQFCFSLLFGAMLLSSEAFATCSNGIDDDGDGLTDFPADPGCYAANDTDESNPSQVGGVVMPSLQDERDTYTLWGWSFTSSDEPNYPSAGSYSVANIDLHGDSEGDDLWTYIMMYLRTDQQGYLERARAWARYFKEDYRTCIQGDNKADLCDETAWGLDHFYGWGLVAWYELTGDPVALSEAEALAAMSEAEYATAVPGVTNMTWGSGRKSGRHLLLATRLAAVTGDARWVAHRDNLIDLMMQSPSYHQFGMYHISRTASDFAYGVGTYDNGVRILPSFHIGILAEAFYQVVLTTGRADVRDRLIEMARYVDQYGLDPNQQMSGRAIGININTGEPWHSYAVGGGSFWEPIYTLSMANLLAMGAKFSGDDQLYTRAQYFLNQATKWRSNFPNAPTRQAADDEVAHFIDTQFAGSTANLYLSNNRGELQYAYLLFDPLIRTPGTTLFPDAPSNLTAN